MCQDLYSERSRESSKLYCPQISELPMPIPTWAGPEDMECASCLPHIVAPSGE